MHFVRRAGLRAPWFHGGSAPVLAKASPLAIRGAAELDGRRLRLRYQRQHLKRRRAASFLGEKFLGVGRIWSSGTGETFG